jgi:hypothetical protein
VGPFQGQVLYHGVSESDDESDDDDGSDGSDGNHGSDGNATRAQLQQLLHGRDRGTADVGDGQQEAQPRKTPPGGGDKGVECDHDDDGSGDNDDDRDGDDGNAGGGNDDRDRNDGNDAFKEAVLLGGQQLLSRASLSASSIEDGVCLRQRLFFFACMRACLCMYVACARVCALCVR